MGDWTSAIAGIAGPLSHEDLQLCLYLLRPVSLHSSYLCIKEIEELKRLSVEAELQRLRSLLSMC